jgi:hypothetical protein
MEAERSRPLEWVTVFPTDGNFYSLFPAAGSARKRLANRSIVVED